MAIFDLWLSRNNNATLENYVGNSGRLFYDINEKVLRISDGITIGGFPVTPTTLVSTTEPTVAAEGQMWYNPDTFELWIYTDGAFEPTIDLATETKIGGVKLGPGVTTNSEGQIVIDSSGLDFNFGDFEALVGTYSDSTDYALLSSSKANEDIVIASNGTGDVKVVGGFEIFATNGNVTGSLEEEPFFRVLDDGQVRILVPLADTAEGGLEVIGSLLGTSLEPGIAGTMLHMTGNANLPTRVYHDTLGEYSSYVFRRYNGSVITPTQVLANEAVGRINFTASTDAGMGNVAFAQIRVNAIENQTTTAQGSEMLFFVTPQGDTASNRANVLSIKGTGIELPTAGTTLKLSGSTSGTITVQATATAGTNTITLPAATGSTVIAAATNTITGVIAGTISIDPVSVAGSSSSTQTFTLNGLTTNHKIVITSATAFTDGLVITAAWASALNTISIAFRNTTNQAIDTGAHTIQYFAWV
jgi:hypothetical protein